VAARIVPETLIGLLRADPANYLSDYPRFTPFLKADLTLRPTPEPQHYRQPQLHPAPTSSTTPESVQLGTYR